MKMAFRKALTSVLLALFLVSLCATPLQAQLLIPHAVYGTLKCGGSNAPASTTVTAKFVNAEGVEVVCGTIVTTVAGKYGAASRGSPKLSIQGELVSGVTVVKFYVSNAYGTVLANQTLTFQSEAVTELNLTSAALPGPPVGPSAGPSAPSEPAEVPPPPAEAPPPPAEAPPVEAPPAEAPPLEEMAPKEAAAALEAMAPEAAAAALEAMAPEAAIAIVEEMSPEAATAILEEMAVEEAGAVMEGLSIGQLTETIAAMSELSLMERLPELSAGKLYSIEPAVLFASLPNAPTEQLVGEFPPEPAPGLGAPVVVYTTPTGAKYLAIETVAWGWVRVIGSPLPVDKLMIKTRRALKNVGTTVEVLEKLPPVAKIGLPAEQIVSNYLDISFENAPPEDIELGHITFKVSKDWLKQNSIHNWSVALNRYDPELGQWLSIPTKKVGDDDQYVYYTSVVTRFSVFAISGSQVLPPLKFKAANLVVTPVKAETSKAITISADITNLSSTPETYVATLWIDGTIEAGQNVSLKAGETKAVSFTVTRDVEATYKVRLDRLFESFTVTKAAVVPPPPPPPPFPWWWIVVGVVVIVLLVYFLVIRRRRY